MTVCVSMRRPSCLPPRGETGLAVYPGRVMCRRVVVPVVGPVRVWTRSQSWLTTHRPCPPGWSKGVVAPPGEGVGDPPLVVKLADQVGGSLPDVQGAAGAGVGEGVGCYIAHGDDQVTGPVGWQPGPGGAAAGQLADRLQVRLVAEDGGAGRRRGQGLPAGRRQAVQAEIGRAGRRGSAVRSGGGGSVGRRPVRPRARRGRGRGTGWPAAGR